MVYIMLMYISMHRMEVDFDCRFSDSIYLDIYRTYRVWENCIFALNLLNRLRMQYVHHLREFTGVILNGKTTRS